MRLQIFLAALLFFSGLSSWTASYKKVFTPADNRANPFKRVGIEPFSQLVFSWNAHRPTRGFFTFYAQVQYADGQWSDWYKMMDWGRNVQRSYLVKKGDHQASYFYVRLELPARRLATGFRVKAQAQQGAMLNDLHMINVSVSNLHKFPTAEPLTRYKKLPSVLVKNVPVFSQMILPHEHAPRMCSPTSLSMLVGKLSQQQVDPIVTSQGSYDNGLGGYGSWPFNTAYAFERHPKAHYKTVRLGSFLDLYKSLARGVPVVVSVRGSLPGAPKPYPSGHLLLVVGFDSKRQRVLVHDPAFVDPAKVKHAYSLKSFMNAWKRSHHLAYIAEPLSG